MTISDDFLRVGCTVYTAVSPGYDKKPLSCKAESGVRLEVRESPKALTSKVDLTLWNREEKIINVPSTGLTSVYLDGSLSPKVPIRGVVEKWLAKADMALFKHPRRSCAYAEIDECVASGKITAKDGEKTRSHLLLTGFPKDFGLWAGGMIARRVHLNSIQIFAAPLWWEMVKSVPRDQIWLPFVLWRLKEAPRRVHTIDADIYHNKWFSFRRHGA